MTRDPGSPSSDLQGGAPISVESDQDFRERVQTAGAPVLVDFHADWCGPCRWLEPILDQIAREAGDRIRILKVDVDRAPETAEAFRIASVPTVVLLRDGVEAGRSVGVEPERVRTMAGLQARAGRT